MSESDGVWYMCVCVVAGVVLLFNQQKCYTEQVKKNLDIENNNIKDNFRADESQSRGGTDLARPPCVCV